jgi:hypothetical protein
VNRKRLIMTYRLLRLFFLTSLWFVTGVLQAQNVGIGTTSPDANAVLELQSTSQGLLVPRMTSNERNAMSTSLGLPQKGLLVFDNDSTKFFYWNGFAWQTFGSGGGSGVTCLTLQQAYDGCGGSGSGRNVVINGTNAINVTNANTGSVGVKSTQSNNGVAFQALSTFATAQYAAVQVEIYSNYGVVGGTPIPTSGVLGTSYGKAFGVAGQVMSTATAESGVFGNNLRTTGGHGVLGHGFNGVVGETNYSSGAGVSGWNSAASITGVGSDIGAGVFGQGITGVAGQSSNVSMSFGVYSYDDIGAYGGLYASTLSCSGTKTFIIDDPLDPSNKILKHFCMESPEVLNFYRGSIVLNSNGEATVTLPDYFEKINTNYSYDLTAVGSPAPGLYIKEKISGNHFIIAGGQPNGEVSWAVYAERNDPYMQQNPSVKNVVVEKTGKFAGKYIHPEAYGQPKEMGFLYKPAYTLIGGSTNKNFDQPIIQLK